MRKEDRMPFRLLMLLCAGVVMGARTNDAGQRAVSTINPDSFIGPVWEDVSDGILGNLRRGWDY